MGIRRRKLLELPWLSKINKAMEYFGITQTTSGYFPFVFIESIVIWLVIGYYIPFGKSSKISYFETAILCVGPLLDDMGTGIGMENRHAEGNVIYEGTMRFFQNIFNISAVSATRFILLCEVSMIYYYTQYYGLTPTQRFLLHWVNFIRILLGQEWLSTLEYDEYYALVRHTKQKPYTILDYILLKGGTNQMIFGANVKFI